MLINLDTERLLQIKLILSESVCHSLKNFVCELSDRTFNDDIILFVRCTIRSPLCHTHRNHAISETSEPDLRPWLDELGFFVPSTVFQSFRDDGRVNMKGSVQ